MRESVIQHFNNGSRPTSAPIFILAEMRDELIGSRNGWTGTRNCKILQAFTFSNDIDDLLQSSSSLSFPAVRASTKFHDGGDARGHLSERDRAIL